MRIALRVFKRLLHALHRQRILVLLVLVVGIATAIYVVWNSALTSDITAGGAFPIEVVVSVSVQPQGTGLAMTLKEKNGSRRIAMTANGAEAQVIARERGIRVDGDPPQSYDLMRDAISQMGGRVDRVVVNDANGRDYFAQVILSGTGEIHVLKARPADAVALALRAGAPIFVEDRVLDQYGIKS